VTAVAFAEEGAHVIAADTKVELMTDFKSRGTAE